MHLPSMQSVSVQYFLAIALCVIACTSGCFIRNCPMGGKRSMENVPAIPSQRECLRCGPTRSGQCIGPNICCSKFSGCYINTAESAVCERENEILTPCEIEGDACGDDGQGRCVADGVCCTDENCSLDNGCKVTRSRINPDTLHYLRRLLLRPKVFAIRR